jgi:hypothetical protein
LRSLSAIAEARCLVRLRSVFNLSAAEHYLAPTLLCAMPSFSLRHPGRTLVASLSLLTLADCSPTTPASPPEVAIPAGCRPAAPFTIQHPTWATNASLYQVNVRQYACKKWA